MIASAFIFHENKLLLIFHKKSNLWLPVAGHVKANETYEQALIREVKEETNLDIKKPKPFLEQINMKEFIVKVNNIKNIKFDKEQILDHKWYSYEEKEKIPYPIKEKALKAFEKI